MRILQLTDPHLVAGDAALVRDRLALRWWHRALDQVALLQPDCLVVTGDLCQDESWGGYVRMRDAIRQRVSCPVALVPGNHDHPLLLDAVLGRFCTTAPTELVAQGVRLLVLNSHWSGHSAGRLGACQLQWLSERLAQIAGHPMPLVVALHHPPLTSGHLRHRVLRWSTL